MVWHGRCMRCRKHATHHDEGEVPVRDELPDEQREREEADPGCYRGVAVLPQHPHHAVHLHVHVAAPGVVVCWLSWGVCGRQSMGSDGSMSRLRSIEGVGWVTNYCGCVCSGVPVCAHAPPSPSNGPGPNSHQSKTPPYPRTHLSAPMAAGWEGSTGASEKGVNE